MYLMSARAGTIVRFAPKFLLAGAVFLLAGFAQEETRPANSTIVVWDATTKEYTAKPGELAAHLFFMATNTGSADITIDSAKASCGCTAPKLPAEPWHMKPGESGRLEVAVDLRNKVGTLQKGIMLEGSNYSAELTIKINIPPGSGPNMDPQEADRMWNREVAMANRQGVFRNSCAVCHLGPAFGKTGAQLFHVACGICHESKNRASMVPDLAALKMQVNADYWPELIRHGKPATLMPGFAASDGGPLDERQVASLVQFLTKNFPGIQVAPPPTNAVAH